VVRVDVVISQCEAYAEYTRSFCLNVNLYPVIGDPPLSGAVHVTSTSSVCLYHVVTGAYG
jgi:hypothetical protein